MSTLLNVWHYVSFGFIFLFFALGVVVAYMQKDKKQRSSIIITFGVFCITAFVLSIYGVDSYTKSAIVSKVEYKRFLSTEEVMFSGFIENNGKYEIGEVEIEIKMSNNGRITEGWKGGASFFSSSDFFGVTKTNDDTSHLISRPQQISRKFVVAKNLKPSQSQSFSVYMPYPPYFDGMTHFITLKAH